MGTVSSDETRRNVERESTGRPIAGRQGVRGGLDESKEAGDAIHRYDHYRDCLCLWGDRDDARKSVADRQEMATRKRPRWWRAPRCRKFGRTHQRVAKKRTVVQAPISSTNRSIASRARSALRRAFSRLSRIGTGSSGMMPKLAFIGANRFGSVSTR